MIALVQLVQNFAIGIVDKVQVGLNGACEVVKVLLGG